MTPAEVFASQRLALVKNYLTREAFSSMLSAALAVTDPAEMAQPYRDWFFDVTTIPEESRARYTDPNTGEIVVRAIPVNV